MALKMSGMNRRLEDMLIQMREMKLTPAELDGVIERYDGHTTTAHLILAAATMLRLEVEFGGRK